MSMVSFEDRMRSAATSLRRAVEGTPPIELPSPVRPRRPWWPWIVLGVSAAIAALVTAVNADDAGPAPAPTPTTTSTTTSTTTTTTTTVAPVVDVARLTLRGPGLPSGVDEVVLEAPIDPSGSFAFAPVELELEGSYEITVAAPRGVASRTVPVVAGESFSEPAAAEPTKTAPVTLAVDVTALANSSPITISGRTLVEQAAPPAPPPSTAPDRERAPPSETTAPSDDDGLTGTELAWGIAVFAGLSVLGLGVGLALSARRLS